MKTPFSIKLLKANKRHHSSERKRYVKLYKAAINNKVDDKYRLSMYKGIQSSDELLSDLNAAIKKLSPKN